ncbi:uncharacterized protein LOC142587138 [Dermacentor variabilis]|uniref:uncharacterized protein LOC142587138 n=1 Tax=Dermacentor variabilis TaxID=34621 RepID=UPI003F5B7B30
MANTFIILGAILLNLEAAVGSGSEKTQCNTKNNDLCKQHGMWLTCLDHGDGFRSGTCMFKNKTCSPGSVPWQLSECPTTGGVWGISCMHGSSTSGICRCYCELQSRGQ